jgi:hypothetical protein
MTKFLNVDLDIVSRVPLQPLVAALGKAVVVHYVGREGRRHTAHVALSSWNRTADGLIRDLIRRVDRLPRPARRLWDAATSREFNIGIQADATPFSHEVRLGAETVRQMAEVGARLGVTTYAPEAPAPKASRRTRRPPDRPA